MRKRLSKLGWWLPVINAIVVGLILWFVNGLNWRAVWTDEVMIGAFVVAYIVIVMSLPIEDSGSETMPTTDDEEGLLAEQAVNTAAARPTVRPKPFLGHRYPGGARQNPAEK